jgi:ribosomal-protein-alanine N-acetyltransferase
VLEVAVDNHAARDLYLGASFSAVGRRPRYYRRPDGRVDALILRLALPRESVPSRS